MDKGKIKIWFDEEVDILYVSLKEGVSVHSEETEEGVRVEYDESGQVVGIEISGITKMLAKPIAKQLAQAVS
jgi:uncharacterized protein YuzE